MLGKPPFAVSDVVGVQGLLIGHTSVSFPHTDTSRMVLHIKEKQELGFSDILEQHSQT